jgi:hypothetical protein
MRAEDDFVARSQSSGTAEHPQRVRCVGNSDHMSDTDHPPQGFLEFLNVFLEDEGTSPADIRNNLEEFRFVLKKHLWVIEERYGTVARYGHVMQIPLLIS